MSLSTWLAFAAASLLIAISPGPGAVLAMSHGLRYGVKKAGATIMGLQAGLLLVFFIAGAGVGSLLLASERAFNAVKVVGALYLIWVGLHQWHAPAGQSSVSPPAEMAFAWQRRFLLGFLTNATNPKGIVFSAAMLPQFITPHAPLLPQLGILAATSVAIDVVVMHGYAGAASSVQSVLGGVRAARYQHRFFGAVLMAMGAALFFVKRASA